jgi:hypothetical protein
MATDAYVAIQSSTITSATSVTFSSIPSTYTDLEIRYTDIGSGYGDLTFTVNGDTTSGLYSYTVFYGTGSGTPGSFRSTGQNSGYIGDNYTSYGAGTVQFMNYSNTVTNKTMIARHGVSTRDAMAVVSLWRNTNAIFSITISSASMSGTFSLYGIKAA